MKSVFLFLPAMIANASPVMVSNVVRNRHPLDRGKFFIDKKRILGDSKSVEGFIAGVLGGLLTGAIYVLVLANPYWLAYGAVSGFGAMAGDSINSFIKRRLGLKSGEPFIPLDQLSFILVAFALIKASNVDRLTGHPVTLVDFSMAVYIVMVLHPLTNLIAYLMGLKDEPY